MNLIVVLGSAAALYAAAALVFGLAPVNRDFAPAADGVEIFVVSNGVHAAFVIPIVSPAADLRNDLPLPDGIRDPKDVFVLIGWGDARIYPTTQAWSDLTASNAINALLGFNGAVVHVEHVPRPVPSDRFVPVRIATEGYRRLLAHIGASFRRDANGRFVRVPKASHGRRDAFYEALGRYTLIYTCNEWVREGLEKAGVRTAKWSPLEAALFYQLRR